MLVARIKNCLFTTVSLIYNIFCIYLITLSIWSDMLVLEYICSITVFHSITHVFCWVWRPYWVPTDQPHKSRDVPVPFTMIRHSEQKCAHFFFEWCIVGYGAGALWDLWIRSIEHHWNVLFLWIAYIFAYAVMCCRCVSDVWVKCSVIPCLVTISQVSYNMIFFLV